MKASIGVSEMQNFGGRAEAVCFVLGPLAWATMWACGIARECAHMQGPQGDLFSFRGKIGTGKRTEMGRKWGEGALGDCGRTLEACLVPISCFIVINPQIACREIFRTLFQGQIPFAKA